MRSTMRTPLLYIAAIACIALAGASSLAQTQGANADANGPDPREIPVPRIAAPLGALPGVKELPARAAMPDVMVMNDGTRVTTRRQWEARRQEMRRLLSYYAVGQMPPAPGNVQGREIQSELVRDGTVKYRLVRLTFGPKSQLSLDIGVFTPVKGGPFPAVILQGGTPPGGTVLPRLPQGPNQGRGEHVLLLVGPVPPAAATRSTSAAPAGTGRPPEVPPTAATRRNMDGSWAFRNTRFFPAYPGYDWGILAGWAWGASRVAAHLARDPAIDAKALIITGASRYGKAAMVAAAFDDRLDLATRSRAAVGARRPTGVCPLRRGGSPRREFRPPRARLHAG